jgi:hypothetical protein
MNGTSVKFITNSANFSSLPGNIFCYWLSKTTVSHFAQDKRLADFGTARQGLSTSDNNRFLRFWYEISFSSIFFEGHSCKDTIGCGKKWFPYNKAGFYRKWSSINEYVVDYANDGQEIKKTVMEKYPYLAGPGFVVKNTEWYFKHGITWNDVGTGIFCARYVPDGFIFADAGPMYFSNDDDVFLAYFNSKVFQIFADIICQGMHYSTGHIPEIPCLSIDDVEKRAKLGKMVEENLDFSTKDWDSFETSWNFQRHPLMPARGDK